MRKEEILILDRGDLKDIHKDLYIGDLIKSYFIFKDEIVEKIKSNNFIIFNNDGKLMIIKMEY